jgi:dynein heavy chain 2
VLATIANYFGLAVSDGAISSLADSRALNNFLDDGNSTVLAGKNEGKRINFYNKVK